MTQQADYDSPWKEILEHYLPEFPAFFFPNIYAEVDWHLGYEFLEQELQQVVRDAETGARRVDKLVKVWRVGGNEFWVLIHLEVQGQKDTDFSERIYIYNYRIFDRFRQKMVSLAVLTDGNRKWRPYRYGYKLWGTEVLLKFASVKLLDYQDRWADLVLDPNPFAIVVMPGCVGTVPLHRLGNEATSQAGRAVLTRSRAI